MIEAIHKSYYKRSSKKYGYMGKTKRAIATGVLAMAADVKAGLRNRIYIHW